MFKRNFLITIILLLASAGSIVNAAAVSRPKRQKKALISKQAPRSPLSRTMPDGRRWNIENLNIAIPGSVCFDGNQANCSIYGRLYTWEQATKVCAMLGRGWVLPSDDEWRTLAKKFGGLVADSADNGKSAYKALMTGGESGFNAILSGGRDPDGSYARLNAHGFYWTSTESDQGESWMINFGKGSLLMNHHSIEKARAVAVRCIKAKRSRQGR